eukprot:6195902-Pleurochrysis_carterae.AAC.1
MSFRLMSCAVNANHFPPVVLSFVEISLLLLQRARQNFRHFASVAYNPIRHWESGDRMAPLIQHSPSIHNILPKRQWRDATVIIV